MKRYCEYTVCCAIRTGDKLYLSERINTAEFHGYWQFAGGELEKNENPRDGAKRELLEETALDIDIGRFFYVTSILNDPSTKVCYVYYVDLGEAEYPMRTENKSSDWQLLSYDDALKLHLMPGLAEAIHILRKIAPR